MTDSPRAGRIAPEWIRQAVWWQVYPLGFVGAEAEARAGAGVAHRLAQLEAWLDYAVELGASRSAPSSLLRLMGTTRSTISGSIRASATRPILTPWCAPRTVAG